MEVSVSTVPKVVVDASRSVYGRCLLELSRATTARTQTRVRLGIEEEAVVRAETRLKEVEDFLLEQTGENVEVIRRHGEMMAREIEQNQF